MREFAEDPNTTTKEEKEIAKERIEKGEVLKREKIERIRTTAGSSERKGIIPGTEAKYEAYISYPAKDTQDGKIDAVVFVSSGLDTANAARIDHLTIEAVVISPLGVENIVTQEADESIVPLSSTVILPVSLGFWIDSAIANYTISTHEGYSFNETVVLGNPFRRGGSRWLVE
jgi:hypothetical protein